MTKTMEKRATDSKTRSGKDAATATSGSELTRQNILDIATEEFVANGLSGARVDAIAERTRTSKRMIYYYFGGKQGLYSAVLEKAYMGIRTEEAQLGLKHVPPRDALRRLIEITFEYDETHTNFVRLVSIENVHRAKYLSKLPSIRQINESAIKTLEDILQRGQKAGEFRRDIVALDVHLLISAFCFFRISNRYTFEALFDDGMYEPAMRDRHRQMIVEAVLTYVSSGADNPPKTSRSRKTAS